MECPPEHAGGACRGSRKEPAAAPEAGRFGLPDVCWAGFLSWAFESRAVESAVCVRCPSGGHSSPVPCGPHCDRAWLPHWNVSDGHHASACHVLRDQRPPGEPLTPFRPEGAGPGGSRRRPSRRDLNPSRSACRAVQAKAPGEDRRERTQTWVSDDRSPATPAWACPVSAI